MGSTVGEWVDFIGRSLGFMKTKDQVVTEKRPTDMELIAACPQCGAGIRVPLGKMADVPALVTVTCRACSYVWNPKIRGVPA